jgi:hypothetical protein
MDNCRKEMQSKFGSPIRDTLERIMSSYFSSSETGPHDRSLVDLFNDLQRALIESPPIALRPTLRVRWSMGRFRQRARIPWIAMLDRRETRSVRCGFYCDYLFREDMSGVYLSFSQGVVGLIEAHGAEIAHAMLVQQRESLRAHFRELGICDLELEGKIDLQATTELGREYEESSIAHRFYKSGKVPEDNLLLGDLEEMLSLYDHYLDVNSQPQA